MDKSILITEKGGNGQHSISKFYFSLFLTSWVETKSIQIAIKELSEYNNKVVKNMIDRCPLKLTAENSAKLFIKSACQIMESNYDLSVVSDSEFDSFKDKQLKRITPKEPISDKIKKDIENGDDEDEFEIQNKQVIFVINYLGIYAKTVNDAFEDDQDRINHFVIESMFSNYIDMDHIKSVGVNLGESKFSVRTQKGVSIDSLLQQFAA